MRNNQTFSSGQVSDIDRIVKSRVNRMMSSGKLQTNQSASLLLSGGFSNHEEIDAGKVWDAILSTDLVSVNDMNINCGSA